MDSGPEHDDTDHDVPDHDVVVLTRLLGRPPRAGFEVVVIEDACRGIDLDGSVAAAHRSFGELGISVISFEAFL